MLESNLICDIEALFKQCALVVHVGWPAQRYSYPGEKYRDCYRERSLVVHRDILRDKTEIHRDKYLAPAK